MSHLEAHWLPEFGSLRLREVKPPMIARHLRKLPARDGDQHLADNSLKRLFAPFAVMLSCAAEEGLVDQNVARDVSVPSGRDRLRRFDQDDEDDHPVKAYSRAEVKALIAMLGTQPTLRTLVLLLAGSGLRVSEALGLRWPHVESIPFTTQTSPPGALHRTREDSMTVTSNRYRGNPRPHVTPANGASPLPFQGS